MVRAWHSSPVDSSLLMQRQTMDLTPRLFQWSLRIVYNHSSIRIFLALYTSSATSGLPSFCVADKSLDGLGIC